MTRDLADRDTVFKVAPVRSFSYGMRCFVACGVFRNVTFALVALWLTACPQVLQDDFHLVEADAGANPKPDGPKPKPEPQPGPEAPAPPAGAEPVAGPVGACADGVMNEGEQGIDCGATCEPCVCEGAFSTPEPITGLALTGKLWGPEPSRDNQTLYFSLETADDEDLYVATRTDRAAAFSAARALEELDSPSLDGTPHLTADGLTLYFFSSRSGGTGDRDVWVASRARATDSFGGVRLVPGVNSDGLDYQPWLTPNALGLVFTSTRPGGAGNNDIWVASRTARDRDFASPIPLSELNTSAREEGATLSRDGLSVIFASNRPGGQGNVDLWYATRANLESGFSPPVNLSAVNSSDSESDPRLSVDGRELFFSSNRSGSQTLWRALRACD